MTSNSIVISTDLRSKFGPARNQGQRPTCMAFTASDGHAYEHRCPELSAEYLFFKGVDRTSKKDRTAGIPLRIASAVLEHDGQPEESRWPYIADLQPSDSWEPPADLEPIYRRSSTNLGNDLDLVWAAVEREKTAMLVMDISGSFYMPKAPIAVVKAVAAETRVATHAVLAVGTGTIEQDQYFLIRNSWGEKWGDAGYAWLHRGYIEERLIEVGLF